MSRTFIGVIRYFMPQSALWALSRYRSIVFYVTLLSPSLFSVEVYYGQKNSLWVQSTFLKGVRPSTNAPLSLNQVHEFGRLLKQNRIKYAYLFAGPFETDGSLPSYAMSETARKSMEIMRQESPDTVLLPWVGGLQNKQVFVHDAKWVDKAIDSIARLLAHLKLDSIHVNFEYLLFGANPDARLDYPTNVNLFFKKLRLRLPHTLVSAPVTATAPGTVAWKYKHSYEDVSTLLKFIDQVALLFFDTHIRDKKLFETNMRIQLEHIENWRKALGDKKPEFLLGVGTFVNDLPSDPPAVREYRDLTVENIPNHFETLRRLIGEKEFKDPAIDGIAIFSDWTTDSNEWQQIRENWIELNQKLETRPKRK